MTTARAHTDAPSLFHLFLNSYIFSESWFFFFCAAWPARAEGAQSSAVPIYIFLPKEDMLTNLTHKRISYLYTCLPTLSLNSYEIPYLINNLSCQHLRQNFGSCSHSLPSILASSLFPALPLLNCDTKVNLSNWNLFKDRFKVSIGPVGIGEGLSKWNQVRQWDRVVGFNSAGCWIKASRNLRSLLLHRSPGQTQKRLWCLYLHASMIMIG